MVRGRISRLSVHDLRFPTSLEGHGSDAMVGAAQCLWSHRRQGPPWRRAPRGPGKVPNFGTVAFVSGEAGKGNESF